MIPNLQNVILEVSKDYWLFHVIFVILENNFPERVTDLSDDLAPLGRGQVGPHLPSVLACLHAPLVVVAGPGLHLRDGLVVGRAVGGDELLSVEWL